jgi:hypothetical protein
MQFEHLKELISNWLRASKMQTKSWLRQSVSCASLMILIGSVSWCAGRQTRLRFSLGRLCGSMVALPCWRDFASCLIKYRCGLQTHLISTSNRRISEVIERQVINGE